MFSRDSVRETLAALQLVTVADSGVSAAVVMSRKSGLEDDRADTRRPPLRPQLLHRGHRDHGKKHVSRYQPMAVDRPKPLRDHLQFGSSAMASESLDLLDAS